MDAYADKSSIEESRLTGRSCRVLNYTARG
jgi:hypothetical protein